MLKALVTKPSSELIHLALKGFSRTLLIAGLTNGCVAVLKWNTGEIDYAIDVSIQKKKLHNQSYIDRHYLIELLFRCILLVQLLI